MKAGRELDALVAEKVMGWCWIENDIGQESLQPPIEEYAYLSRNHPVFWADDKGYTEIMPKYSTYISDAWKVVDKFNYKLTLEINGGYCTCKLVGKFDEKMVGQFFYAEADTAELAICLAALKAVGVDGR